MKFLLSLLLSLTLLIGGATSLKAKGQDFMFVHADLPPITLTLQDALSILAEYNLNQQSSPVFCRQYFDLTSPTLSLIEICSIPDHTLKVQTLIHELLHVKYFEMGIDTSGPYEPLIEIRAQELYKEFFGVRPDTSSPTTHAEQDLPQ